MGIIYDNDGIPDGWQDVRLLDEEWEPFFQAAERGNIDAANAIVERAYERLYRERDLKSVERF
jgi:hypothetical protein